MLTYDLNTAIDLKHLVHRHQMPFTKIVSIWNFS